MKSKIELLHESHIKFLKIVEFHEWFVMVLPKLKLCYFVKSTLVSVQPKFQFLAASQFARYYFGMCQSPTPGNRVRPVLLETQPSPSQEEYQKKIHDKPQKELFSGSWRELRKYSKRDSRRNFRKIRQKGPRRNHRKIFGS